MQVRQHGLGTRCAGAGRYPWAIAVAVAGRVKVQKYVGNFYTWHQAQGFDRLEMRRTQESSSTMTTTWVESEANGLTKA
jgi:hypothetical protein